MQEQQYQSIKFVLCSLRDPHTYCIMWHASLALEYFYEFYWILECSMFKIKLWEKQFSVGGTKQKWGDNQSSVIVMELKKKYASEMNSLFDDWCSC